MRMEPSGVGLGPLWKWSRKLAFPSHHVRHSKKAGPSPDTKSKNPDFELLSHYNYKKSVSVVRSHQLYGILLMIEWTKIPCSSETLFTGTCG